MALFTCFSALIGRKKKKNNQGHGICSPEHKNVVTESNSNSTVPFNITRNSKCRVTSHESPANCNCPQKQEEEEDIVVDAAVATTEADAYEGEDERDDNRSPIWKREDQQFEFKNIITTPPTDQSDDHFSIDDDRLSKEIEEEDFKNNDNEDDDENAHGHLSDPGATTTREDHQPKLKRSCSSLDTREVLKKIGSSQSLRPPPPPRVLSSQSFEQFQNLADNEDDYAVPGTPYSHASAFSADKVILKKRSSSQILPSRSRRLWWKLLLWSHRNSQKPTPFGINKPSRQFNHHLLANLSRNQQGGYSSDTLEPSCSKLSKRQPAPQSPTALSAEQTEVDSSNCEAEAPLPSSGGGGGASRSWKEFQGRASGLWPQNQWVAFSMQPSSPLSRVDEWVRDLDLDIEPQPLQELEVVENSNDQDEGIEFPPSPNRSMTTKQQHMSPDLLHANSVIQSLNSSSTVAHIQGMGLKVIPTISPFFRLRSVNLSNNSIVHVPNGSLPKGLHTLDLSRNKITNIEGLRELTRLRILNLSYNRISRIGHGLSSCTLLKELYLGGNKISEVEGLHRLLKLTLLDLSFNKIATTKALGQLVANYNSLVALNLLGNPIQSHLSDDQLKKAMCGLLPRLAYLSKQPINQQKAREVASEISVKASSSGSSSWNHHRRTSRRTGNGGGASVSGSLRSFHGGAYVPRSSSRSNLNSAGNKGRSKVKRSSSHNQLSSKLPV